MRMLRWMMMIIKRIQKIRMEELKARAGVATVDEKISKMRELRNIDGQDM